MNARILAFLGYALIGTSGLVLACVGSKPELRPLSDRNLSAIRGADQKFGVKVTGDCESNEANPGGNATCGSCTVNQAIVGKSCVCCEAGAAQDMEDAGNNPPTYTNVKNQPMNISCGAMSFEPCQQVNGVAGCGNAMPAPVDCNPVTEYPNQPLPVNPGGG